MRKFSASCYQFNVHSPFPVTEHLLCCFAAFLADQGLAPQTGKSYLAAVQNTQISLGLPDPRDQSSMPMLKRVQAGIQRARAATGTPSRTRLPITATVMERIRTHLASASYPQREVLWAIACTAFFGFFRLGELLPESAVFNPAASVMWRDVAVDSRDRPTMVRVHLKRSKCDQFGKGADIILGRTALPLCPVSAMLDYIAVRGPTPGPFFQRQQGRPVTKSWFVEQLRGLLSAAGLPQDQYAGHSFMIRAATTAAMVGVEDSMIQTLGRWQSAAYLQYVRTPSEQLASIAVSLARGSWP